MTIKSNLEPKKRGPKPGQVNRKTRFDKEGVIADYKTGQYSGSIGLDRLGRKYNISRNIVLKAIVGIEQDNKALTDNVIAVTEGLNSLQRKEYDAVISEANRVLHLKTRRDTIAEMFFDKIEQDLMKCETRDVKGLADTLDRVCITTDLAPRFNPNSGTTVNQQITNNSMSLSLDDIRRELESLNGRIINT